ncbi:hypothetical protein BVRB_9g215160 isoform A [Beta vulgaris subsp. vulgaris]|nr:hypothetical protein BVRB_9g215160 isoform A [Beta vulgaris subsp. vulgaris]
MKFVLHHLGNTTNAIEEGMKLYPLIDGERMKKSIKTKEELTCIFISQLLKMYSLPFMFKFIT